MSRRQSAREDLVALAWSLWAELGVSGWERRHQRWCVDPEALVVLTAWLGDTDARLRDEATDWCIQFGSWLSATRLTNLLDDADEDTRARFGELAATVSAHAPLRWRGATQARPFRPTGRSQLESFAAPARVALRLRAILGVGARAEVMRLMLAAPGTACAASGLVAEAGFKKRNVADALESFRRGGVLVADRVGNQLKYRLRDAAGWTAVVGELPDVSPRWVRLVPTLAALVEGEERLRALPSRVRQVELRKLARTHEPALSAAGLTAPPSPGGGAAFEETFASWLERVTSELAHARLPKT